MKKKDLPPLGEEHTASTLQINCTTRHDTVANVSPSTFLYIFACIQHLTLGSLPNGNHGHDINKVSGWTSSTAISCWRCHTTCTWFWISNIGPLHQFASSFPADCSMSETAQHSVYGSMCTLITLADNESHVFNYSCASFRISMQLLFWLGNTHSN